MTIQPPSAATKGLVDAALRHADGLSAQLAKPDWKPGRAHIEQARNSIKKLADILAAAQGVRDRDVIDPTDPAFVKDQAHRERIEKGEPTQGGDKGEAVSREVLAAKLLAVNPDTLRWSEYGYETQQHYLRMADVALAAAQSPHPACQPVKCNCAVMCQDLGIQGGCRYIKPSRTMLRKLVDLTWNHVTESQAVPSTNLADELIDRASAMTSTSLGTPNETTIAALKEAENGQPARCEICDWPLAESREKGCVPGDCSYRPDDPAEQERIKRRRARLTSPESKSP